MDFRQLRYFIAVAEELSFSAAARRLHISQPPLSMQVKALEEELGAALLTRTSRHVELTQAGVLFLEEARHALAHLGRARDVVRQAAEGEAGEIHVAFTASVPMFEGFPRIIRAFRSRHPGATADLAHMSTGQQLRALADGSVDVGFLRPSVAFSAPTGITTVELWSDHLMAVLPAHHALAQDDGPVPLAALAAESFILFPRGLGCGLFDHVAVIASQGGFALNIDQQAREGATIIGLVAAGMGVSVLPDTYIKTGIPGVVYRPLDGPRAASRVVLGYRSGDDSPLLARFLDIALA